MRRLSSQRQQLRAEQRRLREQIKEMRDTHKAQQAAAQAKIQHARAGADALAAQFRALFAQASAAHAAGEGASAAGLAAQGKGLVAQCRALNAQANAMQQEQSEQKQTLDKLYDRLKAVNAQLETARATGTVRPVKSSKLGASAKVQLTGFAGIRGIDEHMVREVLDSLPPRLVGEIEAVEFENVVMSGNVQGLTEVSTDQKGRITLYLEPLYERDAQELRKEYAQTLVHEIGHVLYRRLTPVGDRFWWGGRFNKLVGNPKAYITEYASESLQEDFAECFMHYCLAPNELYKFNKELYAFIDKLYKEVAK